jgi:hypothetical protein
LREERSSDVKHRSFLIAFALPLFASTAAAQVSLDATTGVRNKYISSCNGVVFHNKPVIQGDLWWTFPAGLWADLWYSTDFRARKNFGREIDYGFGWSGENVLAGVYYIDLAQQFSQEPIGDAAYVFIKLSVPLETGAHIVSPFVETNYVFATKDPASNNGSLPNAGIRHDWKIFGRLGFTHDLAFTYDGGMFDSDKGLVGRYQASFEAHPAEWLTLRAPCFRLFVPLSESIKDRKTEPVAGLDVVIHHTFIEPPE